MKKLSVIAMAAMTAFVSTSCMNFDEDGPQAMEYGYISLSASADNAMVTRGEQTANLSEWYATVKKGESAVYGSDTEKTLIGTTLESTKMEPGDDYAVYVANYKNDEDWVNANEGYGAAYYEGEATSVTVEAGKQTQVKIDCGTAKNAKFIIDATGFAGEKLEVKVKNSRELKFSLEDETISKEAFFTANDELTYDITYSIGAHQDKELSDRTLVLGGPATVSKLIISSDQKGSIKVEITYDDTFGEGTEENVVIDSATGDTEKQN